MNALRAPSRLAAACALLTCLVAPAQASVWVVDVNTPLPSGVVDFNQITTAIAAAADGDIILVNPGNYLPFTVDSKSLVIIGFGAPKSQGVITVQNLLANESVVLRGMAATGKANEPGLLILGCAGPVWVEDCTLTGANNATFGSFPDGLRVFASTAVTLVRGTFTGGHINSNSIFTASSGGTGLRVRTSNVAAWDITASGAHGGAGEHHSGGGGDAVVVWQDGNLRATGGLFQGGGAFGGAEHCDGFTGNCHCDFAGTGGSGVEATADSFCSAELRDVQLIPGDGDPHPDSFCPGHDGVAIEDLAGQVVQLPGVARRLLLQSQLLEGVSANMSIDGQPGDGAIVMAAFTPGYAVLPWGTLSVLPTIIAVLGPLPTGDITVPVLVPELGPGIEGVLLVLQPYFQPAGGGKALGTPTASVLRSFP